MNVQRTPNPNALRNPKTFAQTIEQVGIKRFKLSWDCINDGIDALAYMISPHDPTLIVGIARGGLIPATLLSHKLNVPMVVITARAYEGTYRSLAPIVIEGWKDEYDRPNVVVIDDILDSGDTYAAIREIASGATRLTEFKFASLVNKSCMRFTHNLFFANVPKDVWVQFPWEQEES